MCAEIQEVVWTEILKHFFFYSPTFFSTSQWWTKVTFCILKCQFWLMNEYFFQQTAIFLRLFCYSGPNLAPSGVDVLIWPPDNAEQMGSFAYLLMRKKPSLGSLSDSAAVSAWWRCGRGYCAFLRASVSVPFSLMLFFSHNIDYISPQLTCQHRTRLQSIKTRSSILWSVQWHNTSASV